MRHDHRVTAIWSSHLPCYANGPTIFGVIEADEGKWQSWLVIYKPWGFASLPKTSGHAAATCVIEELPV